MAGIFVSYRRSDSDVAAGRLAHDLSEIFGDDQIFRDLDTLAVGEDYEKALDAALDSCVALIAVIGPARYLYEKARSVDRYEVGAEGTDLAAALYVAETFGAPPEDRWPYVARSSTLPEGVTWGELDDAAADFRARTFRLASLEEVPAHLALGRPVLAGVRITTPWLSTKAAETGIVELSEEPGEDQLLGLHAIVIVRVDPVSSAIRFANSWSPKWGDDGFGTLSAANAKKTTTGLWAIEVQ